MFEMKTILTEIVLCVCITFLQCFHLFSFREELNLTFDIKINSYKSCSRLYAKNGDDSCRLPVLQNEVNCTCVGVCYCFLVCL